MKSAVTLIIFITLTVQAGAHANYIGYSGAPGCRGQCSQSCHATHDYSPSITVTGFPTSYQPNHQYTISVAHQSGAAIANFNCSVRVDTGSTIAGVLAAGNNTSTYSHTFETNGIHWTNSGANSGDFIWTAPDVGTGDVRLYLAGLQGTPSNGADTQIVLMSAEITAGLNDNPQTPDQFSLGQNYPNPFNAETIVEFSVPNSEQVDFAISNILGQTVYTWSKYVDQPGKVLVRWNGKDDDGYDVPSGVYFYRLHTSQVDLSRKMVLLR